MESVHTAVPSAVAPRASGASSSAVARLCTHALVALLSLLAGAAHAQQVVVNTTLGAAGRTALQRLTGDAVQSVCGGFVMNGDAVTADQRDLFDKCGEMVHTANRLAGNDDPTVRDLGINLEELRDALRNIAGEEIAAAGSLATEAVNAQSSSVGARLSSILSRGSGLQVSAVNRHGPFALYGSERGPASVASGGGASDDDPLGINRWGVFVNGTVGGGSKDATDGEDGYDVGAQGITVGTDYRVADSTAVGIAFGFSDSSSDFDESTEVAGGSLDVRSTTVSAYALWFGSRYYADGIVSVGSGTYDLERRIVIASAGDLIGPGDDPNDGADRTALAETDSMQLRASVGGGAEYTRENLTFAPYARLSVLTVDLDGYDETGAQGLNLRVEDQQIDSLTTAIGYRLVGTFSTGFSILSPQLSFEWVHEFSDDAREIVSRYIADPRNRELVAITDEPDRDYYTAGLGITAALRNRTQLYGDFKTLLDVDDVSEYVLTLGARFAF